MHSQVEVQTNNQLRQMLDFHELPEQVRADEFDYVDENEGFARFFKYKDQYYDAHEFMAINHSREALPEAFKGWSGYQSDSAFSGVLIKFVDNDLENVIVGTYFS